jgi:hypothetical protein
MNHLLNICNINSAEVEPVPIAVTMYNFKEEQHERDRTCAGNATRPA